MPKQRALKNIIARSVTLVDAAGKERIILDADSVDGTAMILLLGENQAYIQLSTSPDGAISISVCAQNGLVNATLGVLADGGAGLSIIDGEHGLSTRVGSDVDRTRHVVLTTAEGKVTWSSAETGKRVKDQL